MTKLNMHISAVFMPKMYSLFFVMRKQKKPKSRNMLQNISLFKIVNIIKVKEKTEKPSPIGGY